MMVFIFVDVSFNLVLKYRLVLHRSRQIGYMLQHSSGRIGGASLQVMLGQYDALVKLSSPFYVYAPNTYAIPVDLVEYCNNLMILNHFRVEIQTKF